MNLHDLFFDLSVHPSFGAIAFKTLCFLLPSALFIAIPYFILSKTSLISNEIGHENKLKLAFLWALVCFIVIYSIYLFFFIRVIGIDSFYWRQPVFYISAFPHFLIILAVMVIFIIQYRKYERMLKSR